MLKRFISYYKPHRRLFALDMSMALTAAALTIALPQLTRTILNDLVPSENIRKVFHLIAIMTAILLIKALCVYVRLTWGHILGVRMEADMRRDLFGHLQKLSFNYYDNVKTGHIMSRISNDLNTIAEVAHHGPEDLLISLMMIIGAFAVMFTINPPLALIALIPLPLMVAWGILYGGKMRRGFRQVRKRIADINSTVENSVQGIREVKSYANEDEEMCKFNDINLRFRLSKEVMYRVMGRFFSGMMFMAESYFVIVIAGGSYLIYKDTITPGDLTAFVLYIYFILNPIHRLINFTEQFQQGTASFERFLEIMDLDPDIVDRKDAHTFDPVKGQIDIRDLTFKYESAPTEVLRDVNINIPAHSTVAIVGESGAGKSTIVSLIPRFYETQAGQILIDGHDIMDLKQSFLRKNIGLVQQNVFLFDSTIRENIMYGNPDATEDQLIDAAKKANIYDFIMSLPDEFDSVVGERGVKLSGGQKQRISIARVFLKNPPIFIFDEATSSLDSESEALIQNSLELLSKDRTTIVIAHRLSTVRNADMLYVLRQGKVVEKGTHEELIAQQKYYHSLYTLNIL